MIKMNAYITCFLSILLMGLDTYADNLREISIFPAKESFENDDCLWDIGSESHFNWQRRSSGTPTLGTGPTGPSDGNYYYYLEADGHFSQTAYLYSPELKFTYSGFQLQFDFCMQGAASGSLAIDLSFDGGHSWHPFGAQVGDHGPGWHTIRTMEFRPGTFESVRFRFAGTIGNGSTGDIALDNVIIQAVDPLTSVSPSHSENYVQISNPLTTAGNAALCKKTISYYDGLGRLKQVNQLKASPDVKKDIIVPVKYDGFGRKANDYLPYARAQEGEFYANDVASSNWSSHGSEAAFAYQQSKFEPSPLNRIVEKSAPGQAWQIGNGHTLRIEYHTNVVGEVLKFDVSNITSSSNAYFDANELHKTITKDENWNESFGKLNTTEEFKNQMGQVVLKRAYTGKVSSPAKVDTYYVYDHLGLLRYVLTPNAFKTGTTSVNSSELTHLCYQYKYDRRKRMTHKRLPGADWVYMVYDKRNRLVATQDGNQRPNKEWMYTKYDALNRPVQTGVYTHTAIVTQESMVSLVDGGTLGSSMFETVVGTINSIVYTNGSFPNTRTNILTETYYDTYNMLGSTGAFVSVQGFNGLPTNRVKGQVTGNMTKILDSSQKLYTVNHYDDKYRVVQTYVTNIAGGYDRISSQYDFVGNVIKTLQEHKYNNGSACKNILTENTYDHMGRLLAMHYSVDNGERILMTENTYNDLGELINKKLHNGKQEIDYTYNIRGWLTGINKDKNLATNRLFGMDLYYNTSMNGTSSAPQFNGNISAIKWKHKDEGAGVGHAYQFEYDPLNRLAKADYGTYNTSFSGSDKFDVYGDELGKIRYDLNGNIESLMRNGNAGTLIDNLSYDYNETNQLVNVRDLSNQGKGFNEKSKSTATEYTYDANGNMKSDLNKDLNIAYNSLNLPKQLSNREKSSDNIEYVYSAIGVKLDKFRKGKLKNRYIGNFVYKGDGSLDYIITPEGRLVNVSGNLVYEYYLKDHLGNTRNTFQVVNNSVVQKQKMDYYPFGMQLDKQFANHDNKYLYNGKELQDDEFENGFKLDWYDYGARMYDAQIGRWLSLDPLAGEYFTFSPFCYSLNNPLRFIDPNGAWVVSIKDGKIVLTPEEDDDYDSFQEFFGNIENAQYFINNEDIAGIKNGEISELTFNETNVFSQAVKYAYENPGEFESAENENSYFSDKLSEAGERSYQWRQKHGEGNYNCHSSSINGSQRNPLDKYGEMNTNDRDKILQSQFVSVTQNESIFGKTVISFGPLHDALFFGKSRDGITFIFSKNGPITEPQIMPLKVLIKREQYGGQVKDFNTLKVSGDLGTGHRNPKK